ncbi:MAG TPA: DUF4197 domain-containing protein [Chitinophagales bacterium]|nr:DUF4197 domain-containing protein [Chitinophagales bacterium]
MKMIKPLLTIAFATLLAVSTQAQTTTTTTTTVKKLPTQAASKAKSTVTKTTTTTKSAAGKSTSTVKTTPSKTTTTTQTGSSKTTTTTRTTPAGTSSSGTSKTTTNAPQTINGGTTTKTIKTGTLERPGTATGSGTSTDNNTNQQSGNNTQTNTGTQQQTNIGTKGSGNNTNTNNQTTPGSIINTITDGDATSAIKEALMKGIQVGVDKVSVTDGFFKNAAIKIPFPTQVRQVESTLRSMGMGSLADNMVLSMNRAAEDAAKQAGPIFINSIKQMTVTDAVNIVSNQQPDAATQFLKRTTTESLVTSFKPTIKTALDKTLATKYWKDITTYYNKIPLVSPINTDLPDYVTRKAIDGLFYMVAQEEAKIRKDPAGQTSDIIKDVFGKVLQR